MTPTLLEIWSAGVDAVRGAHAVRAALTEMAPAPTQIIAVGKAACDMAHPAMEAYPGVPALIATKHDHSTDLPGNARVIEAGHPIPDAGSLEAGRALAETVAACPADAHLLMLVSGGASAVAELLPDTISLADWQAETDALVASGADIHAINTRRREISRIKGGKLLGMFGGKRVTTLAISDVEGDALNVIGSGIGAAPADPTFAFSARIVASNAIARAAAETAAGGALRNEELLYDDVDALATRIGAHLRTSAKGITILGGEPTVRLPKAPGRGGRNQALALGLAREIAGLDGIEVLVAGTDGSDGPTPDAGGLVDGTTWGYGAAEALAQADAGSYLAARDALVTTGPTGTNVMDLLVARKS